MSSRGLIFPSPLVRIVSEIMFVVEDPSGLTIVIDIINYPHTESAPGEVLDTIFPAGAILAIREPRVGSSGGTWPIPYCKVESPSDIVFLEPSDRIVTTAVWTFPVPSNSLFRQTMIEWKLLGNSHYSNGQYFAAAVAYTRGLQTDRSAYILLLNRAAAYLRLEFYSAALADATVVLANEELTGDQREKAFYRAAQAEYGLQQYDAALVRFEHCILACLDRREMKHWIERCRTRIQESETGSYDWTNIYKSVKSPNQKIDIAEFVGPIKVDKSTRGGGRGIFTTRDIKVGELLVSPSFI